MRILQLITSFSFAGAEHVALELGLLGSHQVALAALTPGDGELRRRAETWGLECHDLGMRSKLDTGVLSRLRTLLREGHFDLLHTHLIHADFVGRLAARGSLPTLSTLHIVEGRFRPWHASMQRLTAKWGHAFAAVSPAVLEHGVTRWGLPREKMHLIPNGVRTEGLPRNPRDIDILFIGRLDRQKGLDRLLPALALLQRSTPFTVTLAGKGPEEEHLLHQAAALGVKADWVGFVDDSTKLMSRARVVVMPSRWEGFGLVAAEALAAGCDLVHSGVAPLPWVAGPHGTELPATDEAMARLLAARVSGFSELEQRRQWVREHFSLDTMKASYLRLYETCAASRG